MMSTQDNSTNPMPLSPEYMVFRETILERWRAFLCQLSDNVIDGLVEGGSVGAELISAHEYALQRGQHVQQLATLFNAYHGENVHTYDASHDLWTAEHMPEWDDEYVEGPVTPELEYTQNELEYGIMDEPASEDDAMPGSMIAESPEIVEAVHCNVTGDLLYWTIGGHPLIADDAPEGPTLGDPLYWSHMDTADAAFDEEAMYWQHMHTVQQPAISEFDEIAEIVDVGEVDYCDDWYHLPNSSLFHNCGNWHNGN